MQTDLIRRRHVIYVEGYDPQGAEGYYRLFERSWQRFLQIWPLKARVSALQIDSRDFAHWDIDAAAPNWQVFTRYEFLRQEHFIRANMAEPLLRRQIPRALAWAFDYVSSGALVRVARARWEFAAVLAYFQLMLISWIAVAIGGGWLMAHAARHALGLPALLGVAIGILAAFAIFFALRPLADRWFIVQINNHWPHLCAFARGEPSCFAGTIDAGAQRVVAAMRANGADEIVVVGHSGGGALAPAVITRALELDPEIGRRGPRLVLLTLGSIAPGAALHPRAGWLRGLFARLASEPSVTWIDAQSRKDVLNFWDFNPIEGIGARVEGEHRNPIVWSVRYRDMLSVEFYGTRLRYSFFRLHYQLIMANDRRAPYDYFMLVCGPIPVVTWAKNADPLFRTFGPDVALPPGGTNA